MSAQGLADHLAGMSRQIREWPTSRPVEWRRIPRAIRDHLQQMEFNLDWAADRIRESENSSRVNEVESG